MRLAAAIALLVAPAFAGDAHIGFDVTKTDDGKPFVARVHRLTSASESGIKPGDVIIKVAGFTVNSDEDIAKRLESKSAGDSIQVRVKTASGVETKVVKLADAKHVEAMKAEAASNPNANAPKASKRISMEEFAAKRKQETADVAARTEAAMAKIRERYGAIIAAEGSIRPNAIGRLEIVISLCNASAMEIDAAEIRVELFDKFDNPANGILGDGNVKVFLHQSPVPPKSFREVVAPIPLNDTAGKAKVSVVRYLPTNGAPVEVEKPFVLEVRQ